MIPKLIHYCWFGRKPLPELSIKCIESWKKFCPDWTIKEWNEENSPMDKSYIRRAYKLGHYSNVSNLVRLYAVYLEGGIYLDADVELLKCFDIFLNESCFFAVQSLTTPKEYVNDAVFGATTKHPFIKELSEELESTFDGSEPANYSSPVLVTLLLKEKGLKKEQILLESKIIIGDISIYPRYFFYSGCSTDLNPSCINNNIYSRHYFIGSWWIWRGRPSMLIRLNMSYLLLKRNIKKIIVNRIHKKAIISA